MFKNYKLLLAALALSATATAQSISLDWVQSETYLQENAGDMFAIDQGTNEIVTGVLSVWVNNAAQIHANALNRRNQQGQMIWDTIFDNSSYLDYRIRGFYPKNGETYYCLGYQSSDLIFEKVGVTGQLLWQQQIPRATLFFAFDRNLSGNNYVIDDPQNNRMLWMFEQWDPAFMAKSIGILATDNTTGNITILDTLNQSVFAIDPAFPFELQRDNNNHIYLSSTDASGGMRISLLDNSGQLVTVASHDSLGVRDYPQSMRIVGNTMYVTSQIDVNYQYFVNKLRIYSIDNAGHLTLMSEQNMSDTQYYMLGMRTFNNYCYVFTSGYQAVNYPSLTPTIWKYDNAGNLVSTFTLPTFNTAFISDLSITSHGIYCSMLAPAYNMLEVIDPVTGAHLTNYWLLSEFTAVGNDGTGQVNAYDVNATSDVIFVSGNQWVTNTHLVARLAKYVYNTLENGTEEINSNASFTLFPNPANEQLSVNYVDGTDFSIEIFDATGRLILTQEAETNNQLIDLRELSSGVYFIRLQSEEKTAVQRFVKN